MAPTEPAPSGGYIILPHHCWLCIAQERGNINIDVRAPGGGRGRSANITRGKKAGGVTGQAGGNPVSVDWSVKLSYLNPRERKEQWIVRKQGR